MLFEAGQEVIDKLCQSICGGCIYKNTLNYKITTRRIFCSNRVWIDACEVIFKSHGIEFQYKNGCYTASNVSDEAVISLSLKNTTKYGRRNIVLSPLTQSMTIKYGVNSKKIVVTYQVGFYRE